MRHGGGKEGVRAWRGKEGLRHGGGKEGVRGWRGEGGCERVEGGRRV